MGHGGMLPPFSPASVSLTVLVRQHGRDPCWCLMRGGDKGTAPTWAAAATFQQDRQEGGGGAQDANGHVQRAKSCQKGKG